MTHAGVLRLDAMKYLPCSCPVCVKTSLKDLREADSRERTKLIATHNLYMLKEEIEACKEAIAEGRLWDLVEEKSTAHPRLHDAFVELSRHSGILVEGTPLLKDKGLMLRSVQDLERPELASAKRRLGSMMSRSSSGAILDSLWDSVPTGKGRRLVGSRSSFDTYRIHPVLGPYPAELDFIYPFTQVVAADDIEGRMSAKDAALRLMKLGYKSVKILPEGAMENTSNKVRSKRTRRGASPSLRSSSVRPRLLRHL
jgi:7-cyano-7-deazaguanine tRNA-ribosyltransferase